MLFASLVAFAALVCAWLALPDGSTKRVERHEAPIIGARELLAEA